MYLEVDIEVLKIGKKNPTTYLFCKKFPPICQSYGKNKIGMLYPVDQNLSWIAVCPVHKSVACNSFSVSLKP